jgi:hypothetical protein
LGFSREGCHERDDPSGDEGALPWPGLDQAPGGEPFDRITDGVPGRVVLFPEVYLGRKLTAPFQFPGLDLAAQIIGDLPVHRFSHGPS